MKMDDESDVDVVPIAVAVFRLFRNLAVWLVGRLAGRFRKLVSWEAMMMMMMMMMVMMMMMMRRRVMMIPLSRFLPKPNLCPCPGLETCPAWGLHIWS